VILWRIVEEILLHLSRRGRQKPFGRFVDESQKRIPLRLLDTSVEKVGPAFVPVVNPDQSGTAIGSANA
jgi:hypothetical protein